MIVIALDLHDCILPDRETWVGRMTDEHTFDIYKANLSLLEMVLEKYDAYVFLTSSLFVSVGWREEKKAFYPNKPWDDFDRKTICMLAKATLGRAVGVSDGSRRADIRKLLVEGHHVISLDDMDLSALSHPNHYPILVKGFLRGIELRKINEAIASIEWNVEQEKKVLVDGE